MSAPLNPDENAKAGANFRLPLETLSRILGLRESFLGDLFTDPNDWSFVVKSHAFLESAVVALLVSHLRRLELDDVLAQKIEMSARIAMTDALSLTSSKERRAMRLLGNLRNQLVHSAKETNFTFSDYFHNRDKKRDFGEAFSYMWTDPVPGTIPAASPADFAVQNPKVAIFTTVVFIAMHVPRELAAAQNDMLASALRGKV